MKAIFTSMVFCVCFSLHAYCGSNYYIIIDDTTLSNPESIEAGIKSLGGHVNHYFPPNEFICYLPEDNANTITEYHNCRIEGLDMTEINLEDKPGYTSWKRLKAKSSETTLSTFRDIGSEESPFKCGYQRFELPKDIDLGIYNTKTPSTERVTNNFMIGKVAVGIVLMESTGHLLDWSGDEKLEAVAEAVEGFEYLTNQAEMRNVSLSWSYEITYDVLTSEEPIITVYPDRDAYYNWHFGWINDALNFLNAGEEWDGIFNYANRIRREHKTNWAFTLFIIKNNSTYPTFPDGAVGYTKSYEQYPGEWVRPPFAVTTYLYSGYSANLSSRVVAHETAHVFGAMDEYKDSPHCSDQGSCEKVGGYLRYPNMNCYYCGIYEPCLMQAEIWKTDICPYTEGHIGWVDLDDDGAPDPIDPNSNRWASIGGIEPGDLIRIFTVDNDFVNSIACTEENTGSGGWVLWDGRNYDNQNCAISYYNININGGELSTITLHEANMSVQPVITNVSDQNGIIHWDLAESFAYINCEVYNYFDSIIARPLWNKLYEAGSHQVDISSIYCSSYRIRLSGWRPDGGLSNVVNLNIDHAELITPSYINATNHYDHQSIKLSFNDPNPCEEGWIIERRSFSSSNWLVIDTLPTNNYSYVYYEDYYPVGSETYTYHVKPFSSNQQNAPYSSEVTITARPRWPENLVAYSTYCFNGIPANIGCDAAVPKTVLAKLGTAEPDLESPYDKDEMSSFFANDITVKWSYPSNQKSAIVQYIVKKCNTLGVPLKTWTLTGDTCLYICPNQTNMSYQMYVYSVAANGDTSLGARDGVQTGYINMCPGNITKDIEDTQVILPIRTALYQNYPNPFNLSTEIRFCLAEAGRISIDIYDLLGRKIVTLADGLFEAGEHNILWDGRDNDGMEVASGIYFYCLKTGEYTETRKMMMLK